MNLRKIADCDEPRRVLQFHNSGFTLLELVVSIGIISILIGLSLPALSGVKGEAEQVVAASRMRQVSLLLVQHVQSHGERLPELWEPVYTPTLAQAQHLALGGVEHRGQWWSNSYTYYYAFDSPPPEEVLRAPGHRGPKAVESEGELWPSFTEYSISEAFYADPSYWNPETQVGETQFRAQRMDAVRFPSNKVLLYQVGRYVPEVAWLVSAWEVEGVENPVIWSDLSYTPIAVEDLKPTVVNAWYWEMNPPPTKWEPGSPGDDTKDGVLGRDR